MTPETMRVHLFLQPQYTDTTLSAVTGQHVTLVEQIYLLKSMLAININ